jgi:sodium transport system ATP-binding protein
MIVVKDLSKQFNAPARWRLLPAARNAPAIQAVDRVSFVARDGTITALLGPNGAGKTTTLRIVAGLIAPDHGEVNVDAIAVARDPVRAQRRLGVLSDSRGLYPRMTARENILYYADLHGLARDYAHQRIELLAQMLEMTPLLDRRTEGFSQGERMKTALARALVHDPPNIVLDEPTNGLDVMATRSLREALRYLRSPAGGGKCIVLSSHIMQEIERLSDYVVVISQGRNMAQGSVGQLCEQTGEADFEEAFLRLAFADPEVQR